MKNKFNAEIIEDFGEYKRLSEKYNLPISEILQIDMNRSGVYLPNNEVRVNFRVRFKGKFNGDYETWYALPVREKEDTNFSCHNNHIYYKNIVIGDITDRIMLDTCESSYQRGPHLLNLNSRSRSNCGGCTACIHNDKNLYDETVLRDKKGLHIKEDLEEFFDSKNILVQDLVQIAVVTGLFHSERNVVDHMKLVHDVASRRGFEGELMYFGCEVNSEDALKELSELGKFQLIYAYDNFTKRNKILNPSKGKLTIEDAIRTLELAQKYGIDTTISYISGIDSLVKMKEGFTKLKEYMTQFPIINIYQTQTNLQVGIMDPEASILEYYLESRKELEKIFQNKDYLPKRWSNYRPLWYKIYQNQELENNAFGQQEIIKIKKRG